MENKYVCAYLLLLLPIRGSAPAIRKLMLNVPSNLSVFGLSTEDRIFFRSLVTCFKAVASFSNYIVLGEWLQLTKPWLPSGFLSKSFAKRSRSYEGLGGWIFNRLRTSAL